MIITTITRYFVFKILHCINLVEVLSESWVLPWSDISILLVIFTLQCNTDYGHPERAFFKDLELLGLGRHFGMKFMRHLGYFRPDYQHPFWYCEFLVHVFHYSIIISTKKEDFISTSQIFIWDWDLNLGRKESGI